MAHPGEGARAEISADLEEVLTVQEESLAYSEGSKAAA